MATYNLQRTGRNVSELFDKAEGLPDANALAEELVGIKNEANKYTDEQTKLAVLSDTTGITLTDTGAELGGGKIFELKENNLTPVVIANAYQAQKATLDGDENVIADTYAKKEEIQSISTDIYQFNAKVTLNTETVTSDVTYDELMEQMEDGKTLVGNFEIVDTSQKNVVVAVMSHCYPTGFEASFCDLNQEGIMWFVGLSNSNTWTFAYSQVEYANLNKATSITDDTENDTNYPTTKAVADYVNSAIEPFIAVNTGQTHYGKTAYKTANDMYFTITDDYIENDEYQWNTDNSYATLILVHSETTNLVVPDYIYIKELDKTYPVAKIGESAFYDYGTKFEDIKYSITLPKTLRTIDNDAFHGGVETLEELIIPDGCTSIGYCTFAACYNLKRLTIPTSVTSIGRYADTADEDDIFDNPDMAVEICIVQGSHADEYFKAKMADYYPNCTIKYTGIASDAYARKDEVADVDYVDSFANKLEMYGTADIEISPVSDFEVYWSVENETKAIFGYTGSDDIVVVPYEVDGYPVTICGLNNLTAKKIIVPNCITDLVSFATSSVNITEITLPKNLKALGTNCFSFMPNVSSLDFPDGLTTIGDFVGFSCDGLTAVKIPSSVTSIGQYCFYTGIPEDGGEINNAITFYVEQGSYAETWCKENNAMYKYTVISPDAETTKAKYAEYYTYTNGAQSVYTIEETFEQKSDKTTFSTLTPADFGDGVPRVYVNFYNNLSTTITESADYGSDLIIHFDLITNDLVDGYISGVAFTTGETAPTLTVPTEIKFSGADCLDGSFVPTANKQYEVIISRVGDSLWGDVDARDIEVSTDE